MRHTTRKHSILPLQRVLLLLAGLLATAGLYALSRSNYLLYHSLIELVAVVVAAGVFTIGWNTRRYADSDSLFLLAVAYGCVAALDLAHTLAYSGMGVFPGRGANLPTQLWMAARGLESVSLLAAGLLLTRRKRMPEVPVLAGYAAVTAALLLLILPLRWFPTMYVAGDGLTWGKVAGEYAVCGVLGLAMYAFWRQRGQFSRGNFRYLLLAIAFSIAAELSFTLYSDVYGFFNFLGHLAKLASFVCIYQALVFGLLKEPYEGLFRKLAESRDTLRERESRLSAAEEKLRTILDTVPSGVVLVDANGVITFVNQKAAGIFRRDPEEMLGSAYLDHVHQSQATEAETLMPRLIRGEMDQVNTERLYRRKDGTHFWGNLAGSRMHYPDGSFRGLAGIITDVTERKQAQQELQAAHDKLDSVVELNADGIMVLDQEGSIVFLNPAAAEMLGREQDELWGEQFGHPLIPGSNTEIELLSTSGEARVVELRARDTEWNGQAALLVSFRDMTERKRDEERIYNLAYYDELTGLPNRRLFYERLKEVAARSEHFGHGGTVFLVDITKLRDVNDTLGQEAGDELIREVARRIGDTVFGEDTVARISGGEFIILSEEKTTADGALNLGKRILERIGWNLELSGRLVYPDVNIGFTLFPDWGTDPDTLIKQADIALSEAKKSASRIQEYTGQEDWISKQFHLEHDLRQALEKEEFFLCYQSQIDLRTGRIVGLEALLRWKHPQRGVISPGEFIPVLEHTGMIGFADAWVIRRVCQQSRFWREEGIFVKTSVNLSAQELNDEATIEVVRAALEENGVHPESLEVEITETDLMENVDRASRILQTLSSWGVGVALDDFGKGYSSLSYLQKLAINIIKIDKQFVDGLPENQDSVTLVQTIIAMAHNLGKKALAEGVEREEQRQKLLELGCDYGQGFLWSRPEPVENLSLRGASPVH